MKQKITALILAVMMCLTASAQVPPRTAYNTIVLVHGAWLDGSSWDYVAPILRQRGHEVIVVTLPGHGSDATTFDRIQLQTYVDAVKNAIGTRADVTLVGHSMGGIVVSQAAEQIPQQVRDLIYLAAFVPGNGESLFSLATQAENKESLLGKYQRPDEKTGSVAVAGEGLIETFAADAGRAQADKMLASLRPDPLLPFVTPVALTDAHWGRIRKTYIYTAYDKAIAYDLQLLMARHAGITRSYTLPSSHVPFFSMPGVVASIIGQEAMQTSSPSQLVEALHTAFGEHHARAVHAKGIILEGRFTPDAAAASLTTAFHMQGTPSQVMLRFSDFTGIPDIPDSDPNANPRGFAIKFAMPDGRTTDIVGHSFNGFPTSTAHEFRELLLAIAASGKESKPTTLDKFLGTHPVAKKFLTTQKNPASYAGLTYFGVNAFRMTNQKGESQYVRYQFVPADGEQLLTAEQMAAKGASYLQDEIRSRVSARPVKFKMYAQIAEKGDVTDDPSIAWPDTRKKILLGIIEITKLSPNTTAGDKALSFSPTNIPDGIAPADPMIDFRGQAYPISVNERR